jgi:predicted alpha/beta hydrolase family esterase
MKKKTQVLVIHGGMTFKNEKDFIRHILKERRISLGKKTHWSRDWLQKGLGNVFEVSNPRMPLQDYSQYRCWAPYFKRFLPLLGKDFILIGESLGGVFLAKYLSENKLKNRALSVYLVCPPFDNSIPSEDLVGGFNLKKDLSQIEKNTKNLYLLFSKSDNVVPVSHAEKYRKKLKDPKIIIYKDKNGHFDIPTFPEIVRLIKKDTASK